MDLVQLKEKHLRLQRESAQKTYTFSGAQGKYKAINENKDVIEKETAIPPDVVKLDENNIVNKDVSKSKITDPPDLTKKGRIFETQATVLPTNEKKIAAVQTEVWEYLLPKFCNSDQSSMRRLVKPKISRVIRRRKGY